ncbi:hypothetical protein [uncultured Polaribacter sp.]|uniref:hypothetical protein n=1 Tax=uncultured Polaribacter sp. TaxID=174711 RepID=UPI002601D450|nr:hypothetical protein [uncultured Polaribacter sp.]
MRKISIILLLLYITNSYSQDSISNKNKIVVVKTSLNKTKKSVASVQTNENINHSGEIKIKSDNKSLFEFLFPSLIAVFVGGLAFIATLISTKRQLKSNKDTLDKQTESSLKIAKLDFRKSVLSANRQTWINELRELISELISLINLNLLDPSNIRIEDSKRINFLIIKAEFMLNPIKDSEYINSISNLKDVIFDLSMGKIDYDNSQAKIDIVKQNTKTTLKTEWERVKNGE